jgi:hypothetical protein
VGAARSDSAVGTPSLGDAGTIDALSGITVGAGAFFDGKIIGVAMMTIAINTRARSVRLSIQIESFR